MKKLLLVGLLVAFTGIGFAETPMIINPPRPTKDYKFLLMLKHKPTILQRGVTDYFYTDYYHVEYGEELYFGRHRKVVLDVPSQKCFFSIFDETSCIDLIPGHTEVIETFDNPDLIQLDYFLEARAPKKRQASKNYFFRLLPQKAKVVFR